MKIESIRFEGVSFAHEGQDPVLTNADFDFPLGEICWLKGSEGSGKSSLLQLLAGLQVPQSGKYLLNSENVTEMSFEEFLPYRLQIGYSFDYGGLINNRTLRDNLTLPLLYHKICQPHEVRSYIADIVKVFELEKYLDERPAHVPGRVRKLTILARALIMKPQILLLDDPSVGIGTDTGYAFVDYVHRLRKEGSLTHIYISSYDEKFMNLFDYQILQVDEGSVYFQEASKEKKVVHL